jgi:hypothetical protein
MVRYPPLQGDATQGGRDGPFTAAGIAMCGPVPKTCRAQSRFARGVRPSITRRGNTDLRRMFRSLCPAGMPPLRQPLGRTPAYRGNDAGLRLACPQVRLADRLS